MKTHNSLDLMQCDAPCAMSFKQNGVACGLLTRYGKECGSAECPFYKPRGCKDWIRVEDEDGTIIIPPEEYYAARRIDSGTKEYSSWKIVRRRA